MLKKFPIYVGGIGTKVVTPASTDFSPLAEMFMKRALAKDRAPRQTAAKDPYGDAKLEATYGEGLARQQRINEAKGEINFYRGVYGPEMEHVVNNIPEVRRAYSTLDVEYSEGKLNAYKQTRELVGGYREYVGKANAGDQFSTQFVHKFGIGQGDAATYGRIGDLMERSPDQAEDWEWYNTNHSTTGADEALGKIMDQFKGLGETQRKKEAYSVGSVAAETLKGMYDIPGIADRQTARPGFDNTSNLGQVTQRKGLVTLDENMLHGLEQGYLTWLKGGGYFDHREGATLEFADEEGKKTTHKPGASWVEPTGTGQQYGDTGQMALSFSPDMAIFDKNGKPNENYYRGFEKFVAEKINYAAAGFVTDKRTTLNANSTSSFRPLEGDALAEALRKQRLEAMMQSGLYAHPLADQVVVDTARDLDILTGNGKQQKDFSPTEQRTYSKMLDIIAQGGEYGFIQNVPNISTSADLQEYLANAPKGALDWINLELGIAGLPPVANAYKLKALGVEGEISTSEVTESPTPALNGELLFSTRQRYKLGNDEWLMDKDKLGAMPVTIGGLPKDPRNFPAGTHYELGEGYVLNAQSAPVDAKGNFKYDQTAGELDYKDDIEKFQWLSLKAADPEAYKQQFENWGPIKSGMSTALVANQGTVWVPKDEMQGFIDQNLVWAPKSWAHDPKKMENITTEQAREYAKTNGLNFKVVDQKMGSQAGGKDIPVTTLVLNGNTYTGTEAINAVKGFMLDEQTAGTVPGTANHTGQRKTMKGDEKVKVKTYSTKTFEGQKMSVPGPFVEFKADKHFSAAYGPLKHKVDENGREFIGIDSRLNNNDVLETDPDILNLMFAREREKAAAKAASGSAPKSKVIIKK